MTVNLNLPPEIEAGLAAQAQAEGVSLDQFISRKLQTLVGRGTVSSDNLQSAELTQWESRLDEWLDSFPQTPELSSEALRRENWYPDRW